MVHEHHVNNDNRAFAIQVEYQGNTNHCLQAGPDSCQGS